MHQKPNQRHNNNITVHRFYNNTTTREREREDMVKIKFIIYLHIFFSFNISQGLLVIFSYFGSHTSYSNFGN